MKLLFIYGPPAVGKLTVAREIADRTSFKVFHNHLSIDAIVPIFEFGSQSFFRLVELIRVETIAEAAREKVDLIYTFCYAKGLDESHIEKVKAAAEENGGEAHFVLLTCSDEELKRRIVSEDRKKFTKANTVEMAEMFLATYDLRSRVPYENSYSLDNTDLAPDKAAARIIEHFGFETK